jgi:hypothetical protein
MIKLGYSSVTVVTVFALWSDAGLTHIAMSNIARVIKRFVVQLCGRVLVIDIVSRVRSRSLCSANNQNYIATEIENEQCDPSATDQRWGHCRGE